MWLFRSLIHSVNKLIANIACGLVPSRGFPLKTLIRAEIKMQLKSKTKARNSYKFKDAVIR